MPGERADGGETACDRRRCEPATRTTELRRVRRERPDVEVVELEPFAAQPGREVAQIGGVGASRRVRQRGAREKPLDRDVRVRDYRFSPVPATPAQATPARCDSPSLSS